MKINIESREQLKNSYEYYWKLKWLRKFLFDLLAIRKSSIQNYLKEGYYFKELADDWFEPLSIANW